MTISVYVGSLPPVAAVGGQRMTNGEMLYPGLDISGGATTWVVMGKCNSTDANSITWMASDTNARVTKMAVQRGETGNFWPGDSLLLYRHTANQDLIWTDPMSLTQSDGLFIFSVSKVQGGGTPAQVMKWTGSGSTWTKTTDTMDPQLANGGSTGADGYLSVGSYHSPSAVAGDRLNGDDVFLAALIPDVVDITSAVTAKSTAALLGLMGGTGQCYDFKDGLSQDLVGSRHRVSISGNAVITGPSSSLWTPGA